jgi:hypothetical protein
MMSVARRLLEHATQQFPTRKWLGPKIVAVGITAVWSRLNAVDEAGLKVMVSGS